MIEKHVRSSIAPEPFDRNPATERAAWTLIIPACGGLPDRRFALGSRFLIGGSQLCDLCVQADGWPPLHTILAVRQERVLIEAFAADPSLKVNGLEVRTAVLDAEDRITIGPLHAIVRREKVQVPEDRRSAAERTDPSVQDAAVGVSAQQLQNLSAAELTGLIERELAMHDRFEALRRLGAEALLEAVKKEVARSKSEIETDRSAIDRNSDARLGRKPDEPHRRYRKVA